FMPRPRDGAELNLLYTGGTTGYPKGVMWPQDTLLRMLEDLNRAPIGDDETVKDRVASFDRPGLVVLPAAPLMHGTALWYAMPALNRGGAVITMPNRRLDIAELLDTIVDNDVKGICIV